MKRVYFWKKVAAENIIKSNGNLIERGKKFEVLFYGDKNRGAIGICRTGSKFSNITVFIKDGFFTELAVNCDELTLKEIESEEFKTMQLINEILKEQWQRP